MIEVPTESMEIERCAHKASTKQTRKTNTLLFFFTEAFASPKETSLGQYPIWLRQSWLLVALSHSIPLEQSCSTQYQSSGQSGGVSCAAPVHKSAGFLFFADIRRFSSSSGLSSHQRNPTKKCFVLHPVEISFLASNPVKSVRILWPKRFRTEPSDPVCRPPA